MSWLDDSDSVRGKDRSGKFNNDQLIYYWFNDQGNKVKIGLKKGQSPACFAKLNGLLYLYRA